MQLHLALIGVLSFGRRDEFGQPVRTDAPLRGQRSTASMLP
ncbi:MAG: hypothetical protein WKH64_00055 [Chloroflexia bacterium]